MDTDVEGYNFIEFSPFYTTMIESVQNNIHKYFKKFINWKSKYDNNVTMPEVLSTVRHDRGTYTLFCVKSGNDILHIEIIPREGNEVDILMDTDESRKKEDSEENNPFEAMFFYYQRCKQYYDLFVKVRKEKKEENNNVITQLFKETETEEDLYYNVEIKIPKNNNFVDNDFVDHVKINENFTLHLIKND